QRAGSVLLRCIEGLQRFLRRGCLTGSVGPRRLGENRGINAAQTFEITDTDQLFARELDGNFFFGDEAVDRDDNRHDENAEKNEEVGSGTQISKHDELTLSA